MSNKVILNNNSLGIKKIIYVIQTIKCQTPPKYIYDSNTFFILTFVLEQY